MEDNNFLSPLFEGLSQALQIRGAIQHQRMQSEALMRQKAQDERENRLQDMQTKMSVINTGGKQVAADGTYQAQAPGAVPLGTALDQFMPGPQTMNVPADPTQTVTAPNGDQFRIPTMQEKLSAAADADAAKSERKRRDEQVNLPGIGIVDQRAIPFVTSQENTKATNARLDQTEAFTGQQNDLNRTNQQTIANQNQDAQNNRQASQQKFQHGENALTRAAADRRATRDDAPKPVSAVKIDQLEKDKAGAMRRVESVYKMTMNQERNRAMKVNKRDPESAMDPKVIAAAEEALANGKQEADKTYVASRANYGLQTEPVDYVGQLNQQRQAKQQGQQKPAAAAPGAPATPAAAAPKTAPAGTPKVATKAQVSAFAKDNKLTDEAALAMIQKQGYTVK